MDNNDEAIYSKIEGAAENDSGSTSNEEEKVEEDEIFYRLAEAQQPPGSSGSGQLKTHEEGHINDTSDVIGEKKQQSRQQINVDVTSSPTKGTIAEIADNVAQEDSAVLDDGEGNDHRNGSLPGVFFVPGPGYTGTGIHTGYNSGSDDGTNIDEGGVILEGFLPEDDPSRRRKPESAEERVQRLIDNAITLDESAVMPIPMEEHGDEEEDNGFEAVQNIPKNEDEAEMKMSNNRRWFSLLLLLLVAACIIVAVVLPLSLRGESDDEVQGTTVSLSDSNCLPGEVDARFELAKSILSSITSLDLLKDESAPQGKAIRWIVCDDSISTQLLENQDPSTGNLPTQKHGFSIGGDSGEAHLIRRYILASFFYSTSQANPWKDSLNFLSPDLHECNWYTNYTRENFPFGGEWITLHLFDFSCIYASCAYTRSLLLFHI